MIIRGELKPIFLAMNLKLKDSSRTQILNVNRPSNHASITKTRPQVKQARLPTKRPLHWGRSISVTKFSVRSRFTITGTEFGNCTNIPKIKVSEVCMLRRCNELNSN